MATYNRGRHILPSIESVLRQRFADFELIVVGDGCSDETENAVRSAGDERVAWTNLSVRSGSQSGPNNEGVRRGRGRLIAYLGHDDVWASDHLSSLLAVFQSDAAVDVAVSGCIFHMPIGVGRPQVTGLFDEGEAALIHFFPPSSLGHRRDLTNRVGAWADPMEARAPVDVDLQLRAVRAGLKFASTNRITVHKYAAGHRYLSYLEQRSDEQSTALNRLSGPGADAWVASQVAESKASGQYMAVRHLDFDSFRPGELAKQNAARKGLAQPALEPLRRATLLQQVPGAFALDWQDGVDRGIRWVRLNPRPKWLVNYSLEGPAQVVLELVHENGDAIRQLDVRGPGIGAIEVGPSYQCEGVFRSLATFSLCLSVDHPTIITFHLDGRQIGTVDRRGIGLGDILIVPGGGDHIVGRLMRVVAADRSRIAALEGSRSWKLTGPLRWFGRRLRGRIRGSE